MADHKAEITDGIGVTKGEAPTGEPSGDDTVKGPDPEQWGDDAERPLNAEQAANPQTPTVDDKGKPMEVKGPDPEVWG